MVHSVSVSGPQSCALSLHCRVFSVVPTHNVRKFGIQVSLLGVEREEVSVEWCIVFQLVDRKVVLSLFIVADSR
jgi:hypothetical protein